MFSKLNDNGIPTFNRGLQMTVLPGYIIYFKECLPLHTLPEHFSALETPKRVPYRAKSAPRSEKNLAASCTWLCKPESRLFRNCGDCFWIICNLHLGWRKPGWNLVPSDKYTKQSGSLHLYVNLLQIKLLFFSYVIECLMLSALTSCNTAGQIVGIQHFITKVQRSTQPISK